MNKTSLLGVVLLVGCTSAGLKCSHAHVFVHGVVEDGSGVSIEVTVTPDPNAPFEQTTVKGDYEIRIPFDTTKSAGRFHHDCSREPEKLTVVLSSGERVLLQKKLSIDRDFLEDAEGDFRLKEPLNFGSGH